MASPFTGTKKTPNSSFNPSKDHVCPALRSLNMKNMKSTTALQGQTGSDCKLVHGDRWQQIDGNQTEKINKNLKTDIMVNEIWEVHNNLIFKVDGRTIDDRVGPHFHTNWHVRFDHFVHTRTETHDQREVVHQPTENVNWVHKVADWNYYKGTVTALYITVNALKFETDLVETTGKLVVIQRQGFVNAWKKAEFKFTDLKNDLMGFMTRVTASRATAAVDHAEAEPTVNVAPTAEDGVHIPI
jgi:hypothetical protein